MNFFYFNDYHLFFKFIYSYFIDDGPADKPDLIITPWDWSDGHNYAVCKLHGSNGTSVPIFNSSISNHFYFRVVYDNRRNFFLAFNPYHSNFFKIHPNGSKEKIIVNNSPFIGLGDVQSSVYDWTNHNLYMNFFDKLDQRLILVLNLDKPSEGAKTVIKTPRERPGQWTQVALHHKKGLLFIRQGMFYQNMIKYS